MSCVERPHATPYARAISYIEAHGFMATLTKDGVLAMMPCTWNAPQCPGFDDADTYLEEATVFPVGDAGMVASKPIRDWLGY